eukprot:gene5476-5532_t
MSGATKTVMGLPANPFRLGIAPEEAIDEGGWRQAADTALALLLAGPGLVVLLGVSGTGKTLLIADLERRLRLKGRSVVLFRDGPAALDGGGASSVFEASPDAILLIDEVRDSETVAEALPALASRHCLLAAQPGFEASLESLPSPPAVIRLHPLSTISARRFIAERLRLAGRSPDLFTSQALSLLVEEAGGVPRILCAVGGGALFLAASAGEDHVQREHVEQALEFSGFVASDRAADGAPSEEAPAPVVAPDEHANEAVPPPPLWSAMPTRPQLDFVAEATYRMTERPPASPGRGWLFGLLSILSVASLAAVLWHDLAPKPASSVASVTPAPAAPSPPPVAQPPTPQPAEPASVPPPPAVEPEPVTPATQTMTTPDASRIAPAEPPKPAADLPSTPARLVVSYPRGDAVMAGRAARLTKALGSAGFTVGVAVPAPSSPGGASLKVFYGEDQQAASALRNALGPDAPSVQLIQPAGQGALPRPGTIEISLSDTASVDRWAQTVEAAGPIGIPPPMEPEVSLAGATPADGAFMPTDNRRVRLFWKPAEPGLASFLEVVELGSHPPRPVFTGFVDQDTKLLEPTGSSATYAWRVFFIRPDAMHYLIVVPTIRSFVAFAIPFSLVACKAPIRPFPARTPVHVARPVPRPPERPQPARWSFHETQSSCIARLAGSDTSVTVTAGPSAALSISVEARSRRPASSGQPSVAFRGDATWRLTAHGSGNAVNASFPSDAHGLDDVLALLGGGQLSARTASGTLPDLDVPDAGVAGRDWYGCAARALAMVIRHGGTARTPVRSHDVGPRLGRRTRQGYV